ncbi:MFS transporter [Candidatus Bipolaricaulota bacterium]|nr:MFS transporter [Candidatus Bipolaricaulota bacterium]
MLKKLEVGLTRRYRLGILLVLAAATTVGYLARMGVSVALPFISKDFNWTLSQQGNLGGLLLGIFLVSYGVSNLFFSPYVDQFGSKKSLSVAAAAWSASLLIAAFFGSNYLIFLLSRVLLGLSQGILFPTASKVVVGWFPVKERARANSVFLAGGPIGSLLSPMLLAPLILQTSWQASFYVVAATGFVLVIPVLIFLADSPEDCGSNQPDPKGKLSGLSIIEKTKSLFSDGQFRLVVLVFWGMNCIWWGVSLWLPTYLVEAAGVSMGEMAYSATIPYLGALAGLFISSWVSDLTGNRKRIVLLSLLLQPVLFLLLALLGSPVRAVVLTLLVTIFFANNMAVPLIFAMLQGTAVEGSVGAATGIMNGIGNGLGVAGPLSIGFVLSITGSYNLALLSLGALAVLVAIPFAFYYNPAE